MTDRGLAPTVLVIGGGLAGLSAARSLRHRGRRVRLAEASDCSIG